MFGKRTRGRCVIIETTRVVRPEPEVDCSWDPVEARRSPRRGERNIGTSLQENVVRSRKRLEPEAGLFSGVFQLIV